MHTSRTVDGELEVIFKEVVGMSSDEARRTSIEKIHATIEAKSGRPMRSIWIPNAPSCRSQTIHAITRWARADSGAVLGAVPLSTQTRPESYWLRTSSSQSKGSGNDPSFAFPRRFPRRLTYAKINFSWG